MKILAIDPGPEKSAFVIWDGRVVISKGKIKNDELLIEVKACGICGTDLKIMDGGHPANDNTILGHEFVGIIKELGSDIQDLKVGDKVVVDPNEKHNLTSITTKYICFI